MSFALRRNNTYLLAAVIFLLVILHLRFQSSPRTPQLTISKGVLDQYRSSISPNRYDWAHRKELHPVNGTFEPLPKVPSKRLPKIQHSFERESSVAHERRLSRQTAVRQSFQRCWNSYRKYAWLKDELTPVTGAWKSTFGGWAATLVDSLDTLWIMDLKEEFEEAVEATLTIDFTNTTVTSISLFETNIRYLGGLLSAFDLSGDQRLGLKALELANVLYAAFDTPNRMPINDWSLQQGAYGAEQEAPYTMVSAQIGSLSLEFTRLSQITGDDRWYDAIHRITMLMRAQQNATQLPGMWPVRVDPRGADFFTGMHFSLGANADSLYEYLPKMHALLGGVGPYLDMYNKAMDAALRELIFKPMVPEGDILFSGEVLVGANQVILDPKPSHLVCFVGGMLGLGGRLARNETHVAAGRKLTNGCVWAYESCPNGVMPETFVAKACENPTNCTWDDELWYQSAAAFNGLVATNPKTFEKIHRLPKGFMMMNDRSYLLRPEAIESVFILYRITGDPELLEKGWKMFESVEKLTRTEFANSAVLDVTAEVPIHKDSMESFWTAETLKYFYLLFSSPSLIDLDEYVFNTEAHPLKRP